jgi:hypothetical protein
MDPVDENEWMEKQAEIQQAKEGKRSFMLSTKGYWRLDGTGCLTAVSEPLKRNLRGKKKLPPEQDTPVSEGLVDYKLQTAQ